MRSAAATSSPTCAGLPITVAFGSILEVENMEQINRFGKLLLAKAKELGFGGFLFPIDALVRARAVGFSVLASRRLTCSRALRSRR